MKDVLKVKPPEKVQRKLKVRRGVSKKKSLSGRCPNCYKIMPSALIVGQLVCIYSVYCG
jgi:hypothetical protein